MAVYDVAVAVDTRLPESCAYGTGSCIPETDKVSPTSIRTQTEKDGIYNGLDCCVTSEILKVLLPQLDNTTVAAQAFSQSLQVPVLEMRLRGVLVDQRRKADVIETYFEQLDQLEANLNYPPILRAFRVPPSGDPSGRICAGKAVSVQGNGCKDISKRSPGELAHAHRRSRMAIDRKRLRPGA